VKSRPSNSSLWILSSWQDLGLFVLSPLWVIPLLWLAKGHFDPNGFGAVILAVGGTGHHLPGFIRAYTDPILFRRFRTRFILAPLFLVAVYALFFSLNLDGLKLILVFWGTWHGAMQVNGFLRIYDSKAGSFSPLTSWLDWAMCLVWFGGGLLYSSRLIVVFSHFFNAGGVPISAGAFTTFRNAWMIIAGVVSVAFLVNVWNQLRVGKPPNPVKLLMMASSFGLWWFAMVNVSSLLVGILLFEIVHDIQYSALVWLYNKRRVSGGMTASVVEKFLFKPNAARVFFYLLLIVAYGGIADVLDYANVQAPDVLQIGPSAVSFWTGLFMVSTFLHFYFDGFIWQVREPDFRKGMGLESGTRAPAPGFGRLNPMGWLTASWKWAFFLIPAALLGISEYRKAAVPLMDQARNIVELLPGHWQSYAIAGSLEKASGDDARALDHLQRAVDLNPAYAYGETMLADIHSGRGESELALKHYFKAVDLNPANYDVQARLGKTLVNARRNAEAIPYLQTAATNGRVDAQLAYVLGASLVQEKRVLEGILHLERAVKLEPLHKQALNYLGIAYQLQGDVRMAEGYYRRVLEVDPQYPEARENLERLHGK
jgi:Flp pilus assembly protein TadD